MHEKKKNKKKEKKIKVKFSAFSSIIGACIVVGLEKRKLSACKQNRQTGGPFLVQVSKAAHLGMVKRAGNRPNTSARSSSIPFAIAVWTNRFANLPAPACGIFILTELVHYIQSASVKGHDIPAKSRVRIVHFFHNIPKFSYRLGMYPYFCILLTTDRFAFKHMFNLCTILFVKILHVICQVTTTLMKWQSFYLIFQTHHLSDSIFKILRNFQLNIIYLCDKENVANKNLKIKHRNSENS
ncbi:hypothetical protein T03_15747 [Trichinella britovi]|uniref:Uncharacterized protein n=1 Tax=Trichinella britovi TaxID=45882 RepID=A0A0V1D6Q9_TRIBR|nr:hypothetical protein T03_15747 [Trichinella britovi]